MTGKNGHIEWSNVKVALGDLRPWDKNPRQMTKRQAEKLLQSFSEFGQVETIAIGPDDSVYNGHQRLSALLAKFGPKLKIDARRSSRKLTEAERRKLVITLHAGATGEWSWDALAGWDAKELTAWGMDDALLKGWKADIAALGNLLESETPDNEPRIGHEGRLYNAGEGHDIEPFKLAYRVEAIYKARGELALDLFSGQGQLAAWYRRRFERVVTVDKNFDVGDVDYSMSALSFIKNILPQYLDFDFVDFDDEGCPHEEIKALFSCLAGKRIDSFVLALTDGQGLNLKCRGKFNPSTYMMDGEQRKATQDDYERFEEMATGFIERCSARNGFTAEPLSSYRGREGNVVYQTWRINCAAQSGADCNSQREDTVEGRA